MTDQSPARISPAIRGLYAITPDETDSSRLRDMVAAALSGGAGVLQYRNKRADRSLRHEQAVMLLELCRRHQVPLIVNDDVMLCNEIGADGVHLGGSDGDLRRARALLGDRIIGASCYNDPELARQAELHGADYVAFGACFPSRTKPQAVHAGLELFGWGRTALRLPMVAIGGITLQNAGLAVAAGASAVAVIGALFESEDIAHTARQFSRMFDG
ncbi:MAG TPA: thiamine phosphate synthase [Methylophilaceae bacterium]|jgi:thiamine-phosphate pyrophosphorylase